MVRKFMHVIALLFIVFYGLEAQLSSDFDTIVQDLKWRNIGPFRGGRSCAVTGVPHKPNLFYFGSTGGGVWKTNDGGRSWSNISDGYFGGSIGSIAISNTDPNIIYVGGGEKTVRGNVSYGSGLWKSMDAGETWTKMGLENSRHIAKIRINPVNPDIVYAAVLGDLFKDSEERGVYMSEDGGITWTKTLYVNASAGAVDLCIDPTNPRIIYATTWRVRRTPYSLESGGEGSKIWKSTDGGLSWIDLSSAEGMPKGTWGISGIAVGYNDHNIVYAIIENENGGVFKSIDGGKKWNKVNDSRSLRQRAWYYSRIYTHPQDDDKVYVLNVNYHFSDDGGKIFKSYNAPHGDHHDLWIAPDNPDRMIMGDDGGAQITYDAGETWSTYHNQPTAQFYRLTTDNDFPYRIYAAQQDNSTIRIKHRSFDGEISDQDWEETAGGESAHIAVDPLNNDIVYGGSYGGFLTRVNHKTNTIRAINVWPDNPMGYGAEGMKYRFQWNFPIFFSKHDPKKLFAASNHLHLTTDEGQTWRLVSPDLTRNEPEKLGPSGGPITKDNTGVEYYATIFAVNESPLKEGLIWVGTDDGRLHVTQDGGANWNEVTDTLMPKYLMINSVEPSLYDPAVCYIAGTCYKEGDYTPYIYKTSDYGVSWQKITNGIPYGHFTRVVREDPSIKGLLYSGTEQGLYISHDDGNHWKPFQLNLPIVPITDIAIKNYNLIVATQGRSLWILDDLHIVHQSLWRSKDFPHLFKPQEAFRVSGSNRGNPKLAGTNHPGGIPVYFYLPAYDAKKDSLSLFFMNVGGDTLRSFHSYSTEKNTQIKLEPGGNHFVWGLDTKPAKGFEGMILWWSSLSGAIVPPGTYQVALTFKDSTYKQSFKVLQNPKSEAYESDIVAQYNFISSINDKVSDAHTCIEQIKSTRKQMNDYLDRITDEEVKQKSNTIDSLMTEIETALYQTKNKSNQDPLNYPIKLTNKLAHLGSLLKMGMNDFKPTQSMLDVYAELTSQIDTHISQWKKIVEHMLPELNKTIRQKELDTIIVK